LSATVVPVVKTKMRTEVCWNIIIASSV